MKNQHMIVQQPSVDALANADLGSQQQAAADGSSAQQEEDARQEGNEVSCHAGACSFTCCREIDDALRGLPLNHLDSMETIPLHLDLQ